MFFGLVLIIIGAVFLLQNLGVLSGDAWNIVWPAVIVLLGIVILTKPIHRHRVYKDETKKDKS